MHIVRESILDSMSYKQLLLGGEIEQYFDTCGKQVSMLNDNILVRLIVGSQEFKFEIEGETVKISLDNPKNFIRCYSSREIVTYLEEVVTEAYKID